MHIGIAIDGQFGQKFTGIQHYVDSLLMALYQAEGDDRHQITAFAPVLEGPLPPVGMTDTWLSAAEEAGGFRWRSHPRARVATAGSAALLSNQALFAGPFARRAAGVMDATVLRMAKRVTRVPRIRRAARRFDLLHIPVPIPLYQAMDARCCVATIYDLSTRLHPETHDPINISTWDGFFGWVRQRCARVIAISEHTKQDIISHIGLPEDRIVVTPLACRQATRRIECAEEREALLRGIGDDFAGGNGAVLPPFVLYSGTLEPRKNLPVLLRAFAALIRQEKGLPHRLVLAGGSRGQEDVELRRLAEELRIADRLVITGYVTAEQMNALMSACSAFAYVSLYEGFGLPPLEAMTCGAPVVVSNASSLPEVVGDAGLLVVPEDVEGIATALFALLTDLGESERRRRMSLARAREFGWERTARLTLAAYEDAFDGCSPG